MKKVFTGVMVLLLASSAWATSLSAHDIMVKNEAAGKLANVTSHAKMTTGGGDSKERVKEFTWWRKLQPDGIHFFTLTRFHFPPEVKGEGILFLEHVQDQTDVELYLPTFKKIRRVESAQQSGSFMGSEFSYSDIAAPHADDFNYKLATEEDCGGLNHGVRCWVIESTPATDGVKERTGSSKVRSWIRQDNFMAARAEYAAADGNPWKKLEASSIQEMDSQNHKWMALDIRMENVKNNHFTSLHFDQVKVKTPVADSIFSLQNLAKE